MLFIVQCRDKAFRQDFVERLQSVVLEVNGEPAQICLSDAHAETQRLVGSHPCDAVFLVWTGRQLDGFAHIRELRILSPDARIAILDSAVDEDRIGAVSEAGAVAFIPKYSRRRVLATAVGRILARQTYFPDTTDSSYELGMEGQLAQAYKGLAAGKPLYALAKEIRLSVASTATLLHEAMRRMALAAESVPLLPRVRPWIGDIRHDRSGETTVRIGLHTSIDEGPPLVVVSVLAVDGATQLNSYVFHARSSLQRIPSLASAATAVRRGADDSVVIDVGLPNTLAVLGADRVTVRICTLLEAAVGRYESVLDLQREWPVASRDASWLRSHPGSGGRSVDSMSIALEGARLRRLGDEVAVRFAVAVGPVRVPDPLSPRTASGLARMLSRQLYAARHLDNLVLLDGVDLLRQRALQSSEAPWASALLELRARLPVYFAAGAEGSSGALGPYNPAWRSAFGAGPAGRYPDPAAHCWYSFRMRGFRCFVCDTETERLEFGSRGARSAAIMSADQMKAVEDWLHGPSPQPSRPRFLILPTPVVAFEAAIDGQPSVACDDWRRFPSSLEWLLRLLLLSADDGVVVLSAGGACAFDGELTVSSELVPEVRRRIRVVTTSRLSHCAATGAEDVLEEVVSIEGLQGDLRWTMRSQQVSRGAAIAVVSAKQTGEVDVRFVPVGLRRPRANRPDASSGTDSPPI